MRDLADIETVGVVGAGTMGAGIAQVAATEGYDVVMRDIETDYVESGFDSIESSLERFVAKDELSEGEADAAVFVAERRGSIVGFGYLRTTPDADFTADVDGKLAALYVHPAVTREGVGTTLLQALETRAREAGCESLGLWASLNAVPFYEAQGYTPVREFEYEFAAGVTGLTHEMQKALD